MIALGGAMQVRCPQCENSIDVSDPRAAETTCGRCGCEITLAGIDTVSLSPHDVKRNEPTDSMDPPHTGKGVDRNAATVAAYGPEARLAPPTERNRETPRPRAADGGSGQLTVLRYFGDYELLDEIARGGMGVVFRARQTSLNRIVAVKMILGGHVAGEDEVKRFRTEAEAAANLHHPNIVAIHEVGAHDGLHYFSMDFVAGTSLAAMVRDHPLPATRAATYVRKIAEAIHYAHQQGILHRDLKPSNVLVDEFDEPRITDFGLAKRLENQSGLTASGAVLGTPSYMPPEQAEGDHARVGPASDVYSLGATLYELVTGRAPFRAESPIETMRQVLDVEPAAPRLLNPHVDRDLETICAKCLQKDPSRRYTSAQLLADDLARFLRGEPILARPISNAERLVRWCRRNPGIAGLVAAIFLLLLTIAGGASVAAVRIAREQRETEKARQEAQQNFRNAETQRKRAEANFQSARDAVNQTLTHVADEVLPNLPPTPQTDSVRRMLLADALRFYQQFLRDNAGDSEVRRETAVAFRRVGEINQLLGDHEPAETAFHKAIELFDELQRDFPESTEYTRELANAHDKLGQLFQTTSKPDEAERSFRHAIELLSQLNTQAPSVAAHRHQLARSLYNLGLVLKLTGRPGDAETAYDRSIELLDELRSEAPENFAYRQELARVRSNRGILLKDTNRQAAAEAEYRAAIELQRLAVDAYPFRSEYRRELAAYYNNLGNLLLVNPERHRDAAEPFGQAKDIFERLARESPGVLQFREDLATCCNSLGTLLMLEKQHAQAETVFTRGVELATELASENSQSPNYNFLAGRSLGNLGALKLEQGIAHEARELLERAVEHLRRAYAASDQNPAYRPSLNTNMVRLAGALRQLGDHAAAARVTLDRKQLVGASAGEQLGLAKELAACATFVDKVENLSPGERNELKQQCVTEGLNLLQAALAAGLRDPDSIERDAALAPLREHTRFQQIIDAAKR
jgi:tetratricopeptide (TPR) repeat protein